METRLEYPFSTVDGPDPEDMAPELEEPRCRVCGHEITEVPIIRLFDEQDPDAMWNLCKHCVDKGYRLPWLRRSRVQP